MHHLVQKLENMGVLDINSLLTADDVFTYFTPRNMMKIFNKNPYSEAELFQMRQDVLSSKPHLKSWVN